MIDTDNLELFLGKTPPVFAVGVVEDVSDPLTLGRVKARYFGFHPADRTAVPTVDLPWSQVLQPSTSASTSGIGFSPNGLKPDSWVFALFVDGDKAQYPLILGTFPRIHQASAPDSYVGNSGAGYRSTDSIYSGAPTTGQLQDAPAINPGPGAAIHDDGSYITKQNINNWPFETYKPTPARGDFGLACKDADQSLRIHKASVLALEQLGKTFGMKPRLNSGYRTPAYNASIGGAKHSQHIQGRAFDCRFDSIGGGSNENLARFGAAAVKCGFVGFGIYDTFIHIDTGRGRVWNTRTKQDWFISAIKSAGWYPGKPGLSGTRTNPGQTTDTSNTATSTTATNGDNLQNPNDVKNYLDQRLTADGFTPEQRAAILGNVQAESGFDPTIPGDNGNAYGLFQWNSRRQALFNWTGTSTPSVDQQYNFFIHELNTSESSAGAALRQAGTVAEANAAMRSYERYAGGSAKENYRLGLANKFYNGNPNVSTAALRKGYQDPTGSLPYGNYQGKPSTHHVARGVNANLYQPELTHNNDARLTSFPVAGDKGTVGEPALSESPQYPFNFTYTSLTGHMLEFDDTPGAARINLQHNTGSRVVFGAEGTGMFKTSGNLYTIAGQDSYTLSLGSYNVCAKDDIDMRSTSDITIHADGSLTLLVRNDSVEHTSGKKDILVGETLQIKAKRIIVEAENIDFVAGSNITMEAGGDIVMRSGGAMKQSSGGDTTVYSKGGFHADADSLNWLEGKAKEVPEFTGKSTDLGKAPPRTKVLKKPYNRKNSDDSTTLDDGMLHYGASDSTKRGI